MRAALRNDLENLEKINESIISNRGKMIRPSLALLVGKCFASEGETFKDTVRYAAAAELVHNATLLHDDVVDNAPFRREKPTVMSLLGPRPSVLLGDYWLVKAIDLIFGGRGYERVIRIFADTLSHLAEGELLQMRKAVTGDTTREDYFRIIFSKTGSLFETTAQIAAISVGATSEEERMAVLLASKIGRIFQIQDDILDYVGGQKLGKPLGADLKEQKITLPLLCALENVSPEKEAEIRKMVTEMGANPTNLDYIFSFVKENGGIEGARKAIDSLIEEGEKVLEGFKEGLDKDYLDLILHMAANRTH